MERELRGMWMELVTGPGGFDTLILDFTALTDDERLVEWSVELRTARCPKGTRRVPPAPSEPLFIEQRFCSDLLARGALRCLQALHGTVFIETPRFSYGFHGAMHTLLGTMVELRAVEDPPPEPLIPPDEPLPLEPVLPATPPEPVASVAIVEPARGRGGELFPYVYMSLWPAPTPEQLARDFAPYPYPLDAPPSGPLVQTLAALYRTGGPGARAAMQGAAIAYIESENMVRRIAALPAPVSAYGAILRVAAAAAGQRPERVAAEIFDLLGMDCPTAGAWLESPEYIAAIAEVWQSYFALVIELGYDARLRDALARVLIADHLLRELTARCAAPPPAAALVALSHATVILPGGIFPLPPAGAPIERAAAAAPTAAGGRIAPYAIGDLQMVEQRLVGYALGDIARVESVMAGERRESIHRKRTSVTQTVTRETRDELRRHTAARAQSLTSALSRAIADVLQTTSYGDNGFSITYGTGNPPGTTVSGGWSVETRPGANGPSKSEVMRSARRLVEQAATRVAHRVIESRSTSRVELTEDESTSVFDNTGGAAGRRGIWRWLDEIHEAAIVRYGNRLMFEFLIRNPAAGYLRRETDLPADAYPPVAPAAVGIESFEDITPARFPALVARYPSEALALPPPARAAVSGWAQSGEPLTLTVPDGYVARSAVLGYVVPPGGRTLEIRGMIGGAAVDIDAAATGSATVALAGETGTVQVLLLTSGALGSPLVELEPVQLSVEITAAPSAAALDAWRLATFQAIHAAYATQLDAWQGRSDAGDAGAEGSPVQPRFGWRAIERRELQHGALELLFRTVRERTGGDDGPPDAPRGIDFAEPRQLQFFEQVFEWRELSYRFIQRARRGGGAAASSFGAVGDERFLEFLEADWAQMLVPVSPQDAMAALYFLASGMLWDTGGDAALIPVNEIDVALVGELKKLRPGPRELVRVSEPWTMIVPTTISVLQDGEGAVADLCALPAVPGAERRNG